MLEALTSLIALQALDTAADAARRRINDMPAAERALDAAMVAAKVVVDEARAKVEANAAARRTLEKDVATIDGRMAKFEEHKAAVKTNQEFQALNHEIEVAQTTKSTLEDQILVLMDEADSFNSALKDAEGVLAGRRRAADAERAAMNVDRKALDAELAQLASQRTAATPAVPAAILAKHDQLLKSRKGLAVAAMVAGHCTACHVRLRPHVEQQVRRNDSILPCDSCQRILYYVTPPGPPANDAPADPAPAATI